jgi:hypothetical protein
LPEIRHNRAAVLAVAVLIALAVSLGVAVSAQERALRKSSAAAAEPFDIVVGMPGSQTQVVLTTVYLQPAALELVPGKVLQRLQDTPGVGFAAPIAFGDDLGSSPIVGSTAALLTLGGSRPLGASRSFVFALVWCQVMTIIAFGALIGLALGWVSAQAISRIVEARTGLAIAATIAQPELVMVLALVLVGALLAVVPGTISYRRPVSEGLRGS